MPAPVNPNEFCALVMKSELLSRTQIENYLEKLREANTRASSIDELANAFVRDGLLTHFQVELLKKGRWKNFFFGGKYKILDHLGAGGMGMVFLCEHRHMRRRVAVKLLTANQKDSDAIMRFRQEAQAIAMLNHPNIVRAFDFDCEQGLHYIVMEYIDGVSLQTLIDARGPISVARAVNFICQAACGLQHAADMGLVHRDVKPSNLMLDWIGTIKLLDLGLARIQSLPDAQTSSDTKTVLGTADYLAPEQARRSSVDIRADIYGLGAVAYFLLTGRPPFYGGNVSQKLYRHQSEVPVRIDSINRNVPEGVARVIARMLEKSPNARYQTPREIVEDLNPWLEDIAPPSPEEMPCRSPQPRDADTKAKHSTTSMSRSSRALILKTMVAIGPSHF